MGEASYLIVVGAGPAGLIAAGTAARYGIPTLLLEKMDRPGRKLRITGKGRCNLTNQTDVRDFISHFGKNGAFLYQSFSRFFVSDLVQFLEGLGIKIVVERGGRIFPAELDAVQVTERVSGWTIKQGVQLETHRAVKEILVHGGRAAGVALQDGTQIPAKAVIVASGGASYTGTGSSGDGYRMAERAGHTIIPIRPALVPLKTAGRTAADLQGLTLKNVRASVIVDGKKTASEFGEMLFTHFGLSGPIILTLSGRVVDALRNGSRVQITIDLKPALDEQKLDNRLLREINAHHKQQFSTMLKELLPASLIPVCVEQNVIPAEKICAEITAKERHRLLVWLKDFRFEVVGSLPLEAAIITAGGVALNEIDPRSMQSKLVAGLYFAGEVLDVNADTGGYNLQAAFSTGWMAGMAIVQQFKTDQEKR
ncbi:MAG: NAD(P)/FAD-dependent oxidoreductase [Chloroflexi bacterium]|nr:NAD(P)/FAD-dependent oxidoreductase [Chloroflexota bacterium]